jgi:NAD(P)H-flavin reductase
VSHYLTQIIKPWDQVLFKGPVWHYIHDNTHENYLLISTWSGLSPNLGILEHLLYSKRQTTIVSLFGERAREKMVDSCTQLLTTQDNRLTSLITYSKEWPVADWERSGYVQEHLDECLSVFGEERNIQVFLCGRPEMVKEVEERLIRLWISKKLITTEKY